MSSISTTRHRHALWLLIRHSDMRSGESSSLRLARLAADLDNGTTQHTPRLDGHPEWQSQAVGCEEIAVSEDFPGRAVGDDGA